MTQRFLVDAAGRYIGAFDGVAPPVGSVEVPSAPVDAWHRWTGAAWQPDYPIDLLLDRVDALRDAALAAVAWNGHQVATRGEPLTLLIGRAAAYAAGVRTADSHWMMADGSLVTLTQGQFLEMAAAVDAGLDAAYARSFALKAEIAAGTLTTPAAIDAAWAAA
jgi:hypothetical protein